MREQTAHARPVARRVEDGCSGGDCGTGGPFIRAPITIVTFTGPSEEVVKPSEGLQGLFFVVTIEKLDGGCVIFPGGSKGVVILLVESALVRGFRDRAGGMLDGDNMVAGGTFIG